MRPEYLRLLPPEWFTCMRFDAKTDVWMLGLLLYELIVRKFPFDGDTYEEIRKEHINFNFGNKLASWREQYGIMAEIL